jgi:hypothetical protein
MYRLYVWFSLFSVLACFCNATRGEKKRLIQFLTTPDNEIDVTGFLLQRSNLHKVILSKKGKRKADKEEAKQRRRDGTVFQTRQNYPRKDPFNSQWYYKNVKLMN